MSIINTVRVIEALSELSTHENLRATVTESAKGAFIVGGCAFVGGLIGGPVGLGVGGVVGAVAGAYHGKGKYKPVAHVLMDMTPDQKERLTYSVIQAFNTIGTNDALILLSMVMTTESVKAVALDVLRTFLTQEGYALQ